jgi:hypothetical protein
MEEKAYFKVCRPQVIFYLPPGTLVKRLCGFYLNYQLAVDDHIEALTHDFLALVKDWHRDLAAHCVPTVL